MSEHSKNVRTAFSESQDKKLEAMDKRANRNHTTDQYFDKKILDKSLRNIMGEFSTNISHITSELNNNITIEKIRDNANNYGPVGIIESAMNLLYEVMFYKDNRTASGQLLLLIYLVIFFLRKMF